MTHNGKSWVLEVGLNFSAHSDRNRECAFLVTETENVFFFSKKQVKHDETFPQQIQKDDVILMGDTIVFFAKPTNTVLNFIFDFKVLPHLSCFTIYWLITSMVC